MSQASGIWRDGFVAVGSNIEPEAHILRAVRLLAQEVRVVAVSSFYRSRALKRPDQPDFLNGMVKIRTSLEPWSLKYDVLRGIEAKLGRQRGPDRYEARCIDLDLAVLGALVMKQDGLEVPDPDIRTRPFLAVPLLEVAPNLILPDSGIALSELAEAHDTSELALDEVFSQKIRAEVAPS